MFDKLLEKINKGNIQQEEYADEFTHKLTLILKDLGYENAVVRMVYANPEVYDRCYYSLRKYVFSINGRFMEIKLVEDVHLKSTDVSDMNHFITAREVFREMVTYITYV